MSYSDVAVFQDDNLVPVLLDSQVSSLPQSLQQPREPAHDQSPWMEQLKERFDDITSLDVGWDGYEGKPVSFQHAVFAAMLAERLYSPGVPAPQIVPGNDGTLQLEWHRSGLSIELDVIGPYRVFATKITRDCDTVEEHILGSDYSLVAGWIEQLR